MISVVKVKHDEVAAGGPVRLFKSDQPGLPDGAQARDFIWVGDVVDVMLWLMENPAVSGLFNLGTGRARTYLDLAHAVSMPPGGRARSSSSTCRPACAASISPSRKRRWSGCARPATRASSPRWRKASAATCRTTSRRPTASYDPRPAVSRSSTRSLSRSGRSSIRWYALAYIASLVIGWRTARGLVRLPRPWRRRYRWTIS